MRHYSATIVLILSVGYATDNVVASETYTVGPDKAHKTISSALAQMKDGDTCVIREGVYRERIKVRQHNITLRGVGRVVITGCEEAGTMQPCEINGHKGLKAPVHATIYDVFQGEQYMMPARYPDKTSSMTSNEDWGESFIGSAGNITFREEAQRRLPNLADGYYVGMHSRSARLSSWHSITVPITGIGESGYIHVDGENASSGYMGKRGQGKGLGYIIGAKAVLDAPGEWYSDGKEVIVIPPDEGTGSYELRTRLYGARITGDKVCLEDIRFKAAAAHVDGDDVTFRNCAFEYISPFQHNPNDKPKNKRSQSMVSGWGTPENGTAGVFVNGDAFIAVNCRFAKSWWCGMMLRGNGARIENCVFEDVNWIATRCAGLFSWGDGNMVRHCTFRNLGASGIEGGNANWIGQYAKNNIWEYNYIENACQLTVDQGFFYVNHQRGDNPRSHSIWRYNVGKKASGPKTGNWSRHVAAYYVDNSSSGYLIHNNIAIDVIHPMKHNDTQDGKRSSKDIWYFNNTFYKCGRAAFGSFGASKKRDADLHLVNNLAVSCSKGALSNHGQTKSHENNRSIQEKVVLKDPDNMDFTPTSEELKTGGVSVLGKAIPYGVLPASVKNMSRGAEAGWEAGRERAEEAGGRGGTRRLRC